MQDDWWYKSAAVVCVLNVQNSISSSFQIKMMPDDWFSQKEDVPYLYLSGNPWACSCSLDYLHRYLVDNEMNVYTRDGPLIKSDAESVVSNKQVKKETG